MIGKLPWIIAVLAVCSPVQAEPPGTLDLIPEDAVAGVALRPLGELKTKADQLAVEAKLKTPPVPSQEIDNLLTFLGVRGGFDFASAAGVVLAHPKYIGSKDPATQELLVLMVPFTDRGKMAGNFGLTAEALKPDQMVGLPGKHVAGFFGRFVYTHGNLLFMGDNEKAILSVVKARPLRQALTAAQQRMPGEADIVLHFQPQVWESIWKDMLGKLEKRSERLGDESERQTAGQLIDGLREVRYLQGGIRIDHGVGISVAAIFAADAKGAPRKLLTALQGGAGASALTGLPTGAVVAAQAAHGDGAQNAVHVKVLLQWLLTDWLLSKKILPAVDRQTFLGVFTEVWQQLRGSRLAVYRNAQERKLGLFSVLAILDTDDAEHFLATLRGLARLANPGALKLSGAEARADDVAEVEKLVVDLGDRQFRVRAAATTRLGLIGEPALPFLDKAKNSTDPEVRRRAEAAKQRIVEAAAARRNELLSKDLTRNLRPEFAFVPRAETRAGQPVDVLHMKLADRDAAAVAQLERLFGPDWSNIRLATHGSQVVVLLGSDSKLLDIAIVNLKEKRPGLADNKVLATFARHADAYRKIEFHLSLRTALALSKAEDLKQPADFGPDQPMTSLALTVAPQRLQLDVWLPSAEVQVLEQGR